MAKRKAEKPFDREKYERNRNAMHAETFARNADVISALGKLIAEGELVIWLTLANGQNAILDAVDVDVNGMCVQIKADPRMLAAIEQQGNR
jgi:hypothetical protein